MEYVYAAMLLHSAEKNIDEDGVSSVLSAAGVEVDGARVKALVTSSAMLTSGKRWLLLSLRLLLLLQLLLVAVVETLLLLLRKHQLRKKKRKKPVASKASDPSSVEANSKLTHTLRSPLSGGYQVVVRMLAAYTGRMPRDSSPFSCPDCATTS